MKTLLIAIIIAAPLFTNGQKFTPPKPQMENPFIWGNQRPQVLQLETVKSLSQSRVEIIKAKLAREE